MSRLEARRIRTYSLFGLVVDSDLPLAAMETTPGAAVDVTVRTRDRLPHDERREPAAAGTMTSDWARSGDGWRLSYTGADGHVLEFAIDAAGTRVDARCSVPDSDADVAAALLGSGLAAALALRHVPVFHASAVVIDGRALLVAGRSGSGKSTLTSALVAHGAALLSDDMAALTLGQGRPIVHPGGRVLRVYPESLGAVSATTRARDLTLRRVFSARNPDDKLALDPAELAGGTATTAVPVEAVCLLAGRHRELDTAMFTRLEPNRAGLALIEHLYSASLGVTTPAEQLAWCAAVATSADVFRVETPDALASVPRTAGDLIDRVRRTGAA